MKVTSLNISILYSVKIDHSDEEIEIFYSDLNNYISKVPKGYEITKDNKIHKYTDSTMCWNSNISKVACRRSLKFEIDIRRYL